MKKIFITATDTDAGKTFIACALTQALINAGKKVAVYKPVSAGCQQIAGSLVNEDAQLLSQFANCNQSIQEVNPIAFEEPIAPHIAAQMQAKEIALDDIVNGLDKINLLRPDVCLTEGAGGWRLPLSTTNKAYLADFAKVSEQSVVLVVNMKLGCLNHALLTYEAIKADGLECIGWVANEASISAMSNLDENLASLAELLPMPMLGHITFNNDANLSLADKIKAAANNLNLQPLL